jgi:hypothetical protein
MSFKLILILDEKDKAYIAGIIDGEGWVGINQTNPVISISNTNYSLMEYLIDKIGGIVCKKPKYKEQHNQAWQWEISGDRARVLLDTVRPYMILKKDCKFGDKPMGKKHFQYKSSGSINV